MVINIDNTEYKIPPQGYTIALPSNYAEKCMVGIQSTPDNQGMIMLGDTFMRNYYTVFNFANNACVAVCASTYVRNSSGNCTCPDNQEVVHGNCVAVCLVN